LAEGARHVLAIEKDPRCVPVLQEIAAAYHGQLEFIIGDALTVNPLEYLTKPIKVAANLPYNVGTELLVRWLTPPEWPPFWESLTLMFQLEVAQRIIAKPGSKAYGRLALLAQWRTEARIVLELPPEAFSPPPKVKSAVVHLTALPEPRYPAHPGTLNMVVAAAFNQRRKMLRSALKSISPEIEDHLNAVGIKPTERAEQVDLEAFCALARQLDKSKG
jgi:16S rRNA (adenine1518-N6/adenine1519-N6)-dimethyltransferase